MMYDIYRFMNYRGEMTMKLKLLFIVMDILTLLAYPIIFIFGKRRQLLKS